jgi:acetyl-CoA carboxylase biotin carboxyl carrier protein
MADDDSASAPLGAESYAALVAGLLDELAAAGITEAEVCYGSFRLFLRRRPRRESAPAATGPALAAEPAIHESWVAVAAPLAGVFYNREAPDAPAFVHLGSPIHAGQPVGLIESMKMFNEVVCEVSGMVRQVLAANGEVVHAGQALIYVEPSEDLAHGPPPV